MDPNQDKRQADCGSQRKRDWTHLLEAPDDGSVGGGDGFGWDGYSPPRGAAGFLWEAGCGEDGEIRDVGCGEVERVVDDQLGNALPERWELTWQQLEAEAARWDPLAYTRPFTAVRHNEDSNPMRHSLHVACEWGVETGLLKAMLETKEQEHGKCCVNIRDGNQDTPLHYAARHGRFRLISLLLNRGANVEARGRFSDTPLHVACMGCFPECVEILLHGGASVSAVDVNEMTPLHHAASKCNARVGRLLVEAGAPVLARNLKGWTPLAQAASCGNFEMVSVLAALPECHDDLLPLSIAIRCRQVGVVSVMAQAGFPLNSRKECTDPSPLMLAISLGHDLIVGALIRFGACLSATDCLPQALPHWAAAQGMLNTMIFLKYSGVDVSGKDANRQTPLHVAAQFGWDKVVSVLLEGGDVEVDPLDNNLSTPLGLSASKARLRVVTELLDGGADAETPMDPLHVTCLQRLVVMRVIEGGGVAGLAREAQRAVILELLVRGSALVPPSSHGQDW